MAKFDESGILTIPITKSVPEAPGAAAAGWLNQNWPVVALVGVGLVALLMANPGGKPGVYS